MWNRGCNLDTQNQYINPFLVWTTGTFRIILERTALTHSKISNYHSTLKYYLLCVTTFTHSNSTLKIPINHAYMGRLLFLHWKCNVWIILPCRALNLEQFEHNRDNRIPVIIQVYLSSFSGWQGCLTPNVGPCCTTSYYHFLFAIESMPTLGSSRQFCKWGKRWFFFFTPPNSHTIGASPIHLWLVNYTYKTLLPSYAQMPGRSEWSNLWLLGKALELSAANLPLIGPSIQRAASMPSGNRWRQEGMGKL